jgi:hypothetical protein
MKRLFEVPTSEIAAKNTCPCGHSRDHHCQVGASGLWIGQGRFKRLVRCVHSGDFATDESATCSGGSCAVSGCPCIGMPVPRLRKKKEKTDV